MKIVSDKYFPVYRQNMQLDLEAALNEIAAIDLSDRSFTFYTSVAVISSSSIEGEQMETDSYVKHKMQDVEYLPELTEKPNDLYKAYLFAKQNRLTLQNLLQSHSLLSQHLLPQKHRCTYRKNEMLIMEHQTGRIQFEAAPFNIIEDEMNALF